jgi:hypothetical protein
LAMVNGLCSRATGSSHSEIIYPSQNLNHPGVSDVASLWTCQHYCAATEPVTPFAIAFSTPPEDIFENKYQTMTACPSDYEYTSKCQSVEKFAHHLVRALQALQGLKSVLKSLPTFQLCSKGNYERYQRAKLPYEAT